MNIKVDIGSLPFPDNHDEAAARLKNFAHFDPFASEIPPALLNSEDISEYVRVTGMVHPFNRKNDKLKPASYEVDFLGEVYFWKEGEKDFTRKEISFGEPFEIPKNSIVFVSPETTFRLPDYIALRFNLRIKHVHRGLLLGTGPLVDPGFAGRLFIPLHNLTSEPYVIKGGEGLIWVEFTKISPHPHWVKQEENCGKYVHFPETAHYQKPQQYLNKSSLNGKPARSSIPLEVEEAKTSSTEALTKVSQAISDVEAFENKIKKWGVVGTIVGAIAILVPIYALVYDGISYVSTSKDSINTSVTALQKTINEQSIAIQDLKSQITSLEAKYKISSSTRNNSVAAKYCAATNCVPTCDHSTQKDCQRDCLPDCLPK